jgi:hypothetical protein
VTSDGRHTPNEDAAKDLNDSKGHYWSALSGNHSSWKAWHRNWMDWKKRQQNKESGGTKDSEKNKDSGEKKASESKAEPTNDDEQELTPIIPTGTPGLPPVFARSGLGETSAPAFPEPAPGPTATEILEMHMQRRQAWQARHEERLKMAREIRRNIRLEELERDDRAREKSTGSWKTELRGGV